MNYAFFLLQFVIFYIFFMDICHRICIYRKLVLSLQRLIKKAKLAKMAITFHKCRAEAVRVGYKHIKDVYLTLCYRFF